ncbi:pyocin knob domain-containing protein [uncultured Bacteroides sp.]|uniref:pyocin knob domain-containing protein n=1 Tax=uncultured Bacteroides sp. TaxID=162156 RepID=UPI00260202BC|nr:pyocin knob domain-containing protein [uncultured Bacteroides sp.]
MYRGIAGDMNNILEVGYYSSVSNITTNYPDKAYTHGVLEVFGGGNFIAQRYTPHANYSGNFGEYTRIRYDDKWGSWRFIPYQ